MANINEIGAKVREEVIILSSSDEEKELPKEMGKVDLMKTLELNEASSKDSSQSSDVPASSSKDLEKPIVENIDSSSLDDSTNLHGSNDLVNKFVSTLSCLVKKDEIDILKVIYRLQRKCQPEYLNSEEFEHLIDSVLVKAEKDVKNVFVYAKEVYDEMKAYSLKSNNKFLNGNSEVNSGASTSTLDNGKEDSNERHIRKLEKVLKKLDRKIRHLKMKELTLDEMDQNCSAYIYEDKLQKQLLKVWEKLCKIKKRSPSLGNHQEKKFRFQASRYPELNRRVEKLINTTKAFPDYTDVLKISREVNKESCLGLTEAFLQNLAKEVFEDIGKELKSRRMRDDQELFGCFLTDELDSEKDPAEEDPALKETLEKSYVQGQEALNEVMFKYTEQQFSLKLEPEEVPDEEETSRPASDQEDDEEDREIEREQILDDEEGSDDQALEACDSSQDNDTRSNSSSDDSVVSSVLPTESHLSPVPENTPEAKDTEIKMVGNGFPSCTVSKSVSKSATNGSCSEENLKRSCLARLKLSPVYVSSVEDGSIDSPTKRIRLDVPDTSDLLDEDIITLD